MISYKARCTNGVYEHVVTVWVDRRLARMPYAQAGVIEHVDTIDVNGRYKRIDGYTLISYETVAATLTTTGILEISCLCSVSTRNHVTAFLREFYPNIGYYEAKAAFYGNYAIDINTGNHINLATGEILNYKKEA